MQTELELLASRLVPDEDREPVNFGEETIEKLKELMGGVDQEKLEEVSEEIENANRSNGNFQNETRTSDVINKRKTKSLNRVKLDLGESTEMVIESFFSIYDNLIAIFESMDMDHPLSSLIIKTIDHTVESIRSVGGVVDDFNPIDHVSGLSTPVFSENAKKVIENTIKYYNAGEVTEAKIKSKSNGRTIVLVFSGEKFGFSFKATGEVSGDWSGNEAIDYIYTPKSGKMSVKALKNGRWTNAGEKDEYQIVWELEEIPVESKVSPDENESPEEDGEEI